MGIRQYLIMVDNDTPCKLRVAGSIIWVVVVLSVVNGLCFGIWYNGAANPEQYGTYNCYICNCVVNIFENTTTAITFVDLTYGLNGYNTTANFELNRKYVNYCNETTSITCYHYDDDITSLTLDEDDVKYDGVSPGFVIGMTVFINIIACFACTLMACICFSQLLEKN